MGKIIQTEISTPPRHRILYPAGFNLDAAWKKWLWKFKLIDYISCVAIL